MTKEKHPCKDCKYGYFTIAKEEKVFYNALADKVDVTYMDTNKPACGFSPGGILLDGDNPLCANYEKIGDEARNE